MKRIILLITLPLLNALLYGCWHIPQAGSVKPSGLASIQHTRDIKRPDQSWQTNLALPKISSDDDVVNHIGFSASYNHNTLCPNWVAYGLTAEKVKGSFKGKESFRWDPVLKGRQANREDYKNDQQWDKGHMVPKADMKWSVQAYEESFFLTNICPQDHSFNAGAWCSLEKLVRRMATKYGCAYIIAGPIIGAGINGTLGESEVSIPDKFFKAILIPKNNSYSAVAFVMNNSPKNKPLKLCAMPVDSLERIIGIDLFIGLDDKTEQTVESQVIYSDWGL